MHLWNPQRFWAQVPEWKIWFIKINNSSIIVNCFIIVCIKEEERRLRDEHIAYQQQEAKVQRERQEDLLMREAKARAEVMKVMREKRKRLQQREVSCIFGLK